MATQYSDWYATSQPGLALASPSIKVPWGVNNRHYKRASVQIDLAPDDFGAGDVARILTLKSTDRISAIHLAGTGVGGTSTALVGHIGLYESGLNHDGVAADADRFAATKNLFGTIDRDECFDDTGATVATDRGKMVWEILGLSADTGKEYDLAVTCTTAIATVDQILVFEVEGSFS